MLDVASARQALQAKAAKQVARFPQYAGHFDEYKVVRVLKQIKTKSGISFEKDELAIAKPEIEHFVRPNGRKGQGITVWSTKLGWDVGILCKDVEILEGWFVDVNI